MYLPQYNNDLGQTSLIQHQIDTPLNDVVYQILKVGGHFKVIHVDQLAQWNGENNLDHGLDEDAQY